MVDKNKFYLEKINNIVFLGYSSLFDEFIKFNLKLNINSKIITSTDQSKLIKNEFIVFDSLGEEFIKYVKDNFNIKDTLFISFGSRNIFKKNIIKELKNNLINFHCTRLPLDKGGGGFSWSILREDRIDNQLVHLIDKGIDTGPIIYYKHSLFPKECKIPLDFELSSKINLLKFYQEFIIKIKEGKKFELMPQIDYIGRYNPRLNTNLNGYIDWNFTPHDLYNFINAFDDPYDGAISYLNRGNFGKLRIKKVHLHGGDSSNHPYMSGIVTRHDNDWIVVATSGKYMLLVEQVLDKNKNNIIKKIREGDRFFNNYDDLLKSKSEKIIYNSKGLKNEN